MEDTAQLVPAQEPALQSVGTPLPTPGRIVHVNIGQERLRPALVIEAGGAFRIVAQLFVHHSDVPLHLPQRLDHSAQCIYMGEFTFGERVGEWRWPARG